MTHEWNGKFKHVYVH